MGHPHATRKLIDLCVNHWVPVISPTGPAIDLSTQDGQNRLRREVVEAALPAIRERLRARGDLRGLGRAVIDARRHTWQGDDQAVAMDRAVAETWLGFLARRFGGELPSDLERQRAELVAELDRATNPANRPRPPEDPSS